MSSAGGPFVTTVGGALVMTVGGGAFGVTIVGTLFITIGDYWILYGSFCDSLFTFFNGFIDLFLFFCFDLLFDFFFFEFKRDLYFCEFYCWCGLKRLE